MTWHGFLEASIEFDYYYFFFVKYFFVSIIRHKSVKQCRPKYVIVLLLDKFRFETRLIVVTTTKTWRLNLFITTYD